MTLADTSDRILATAVTALRRSPRSGFELRQVERFGFSPNRGMPRTEHLLAWAVRPGTG